MLLGPDLPLIVWYVLVLVFLEGVLSADNALVLAVMVRHLPKPQQKRALRYGIWGAFGFRAIAVVLSAQLMRFWLFKLVGGAFLLFLSFRHFFESKDEDQAGRASRFGSGFWGTVISVELADIAFSIDSILTAVAMGDSLPQRLGPNWRLAIVYIGGVLGILTMRFVAGFFIILLERFRGLEGGAYVLVAWIGLELIGSGVHNATNLPTAIPDWLFWSVMAVIVVVSMIYKPPPRDVEKKEADALVEVGKALEGEEPQA